MGKYWDWYEVEFERVAKRRLSPERQASILESLRDHVQEATEELSNATTSKEEAERLAIKNIGAPQDVVLAELNQPRRQWWPAWIALCGLIWCALWLVAGARDLSMQMIYPALWLTPVGVAVASAIGRKVKLWALFGATSAVATATLTAVTFTWLHLGSAGSIGMCPMWMVEQETLRVKQSIADTAGDITYLERTYSAFMEGDSEKVKVLAFAAKRGWQAPSPGFYAQNRIAYQSFPTYETARTQWQREFKRAHNTLSKRRGELQTTLSAFNSPRARNPRAMFVEGLYPMVGVMLGVYGVLSAAHLLALVVVNLQAVTSRRRWRAALQ